MTRRSRLILAMLAVIAIVGGALLISRKPANNLGAPAVAAGIAVELVRPSEAMWPSTLSASGPLSAWQEATISAETGGLRIVALHADVGSRVKRGQLLAELNSETVKVDLQKAEAAVASSRASLREAQAKARRGRAVRESGALSTQQIEEYEIAEESAVANLASAQASLVGARVKLAQTRIVAVDNGIISSRSATLGAVLNSGSELFRLVRDERVEWRAEIDANQLAQLKTGLKATVILSGGTAVEGKVRQLSPTLNSETRTAFAYVDLPVLAAARAGAYVQGRIELGQRPAMTLPSSAITLRDGRSYVFEITPQNKVVIQREVVTGRTRDNLIEIVSGIKPGTPVVRSGGAFLNGGDSVRVSNTKEAA